MNKSEVTKKDDYNLPVAPVLLIVFSRAETTRKVFQAIRQIQPKKFFLAADGPRPDHPADKVKCEEVRRIVSEIDWDCEVKTLFRNENAGCGKSVSGAITWFFEHVEEGIILEDDCLPSPQFFRFCSELLDYYRNDKRVMQIGGNNLNARRPQGEASSYFFSQHNFIWGWATWRRAWQFFDFAMCHYEEIMEKKYLVNYFHSLGEQDYHRYVFDKTHNEIEDTSIWDYQWQFARMLQAGLAIVPWNNLVINIGFGTEATHTSSYEDIIPGLKIEYMEFPLRHPECMMVDRMRDAQIFNRVFTPPWSRIKQHVKLLIPDRVLNYHKKITT